MPSDLWRVFGAALASRALVLCLGLASDWAVADYDTSARYDVPNTSAGCAMSDGDDIVLQARAGCVVAACLRVGVCGRVLRGVRVCDALAAAVCWRAQKHPLARAFCRVVEVRFHAPCARPHRVRARTAARP